MGENNKAYYVGMTNDKDGRFRKHKWEAARSEFRNRKKSEGIPKMWKDYTNGKGLVNVLCWEELSQRFASIIERSLVAAAKGSTNSSVGSASYRMLNVLNFRGIKEMGYYLMQHTQLMTSASKCFQKRRIR
uniref:GIY-YIG domain-containing protein n=1 Tax=Rhabditophanes sp. KR3021 TaxID=114890 RepID=A0AC35UH15_9BILA